MEEIHCLQSKVANLRATLFLEGFLDDQFTQLQRLQITQPGFVFEITTLYLRESEKLIDELVMFLNQNNVDLEKVHAHLHQLKGSSVSVGAQRVKVVCDEILGCYKENNKERCREFVQKLKREHSLLKARLELLFSLEQRVAAVNSRKQ